MNDTCRLTVSHVVSLLSVVLGAPVPTGHFLLKLGGHSPLKFYIPAKHDTRCTEWLPMWLVW